MAYPKLATEGDPTSEEPAAAGPSGGGPLDERVGRLEDRVGRLQVAVEGLHGEVRGLRHAQIVTITAISIFAVAILGLGTYTLTRVDRLPSELNAIANSLANAITATRPSQPIIVNVPPVQAPSPGLPQPSQPDQ